MRGQRRCFETTLKSFPTHCTHACWPEETGRQQRSKGQMQRRPAEAPCLAGGALLAGVGSAACGNRRSASRRPASIPKPLPMIEGYISDDGLREAVRFPMRHLRVAFDHLSHRRPMPFVLACSKPPRSAIGACSSPIGCEVRFGNRRNIRHFPMVAPLEQKVNKRCSPNT